MEEWYEVFRAGGFPPVAGAWNQRAALIGRAIRVSGAGGEASGVCAGLDVDGALLLDDQATGARQRVLAGDVTVQGGYDS
jgi:BirA family biotin operon repressor/biotin-[acetyl-CoA-carboxylase] ligase